jgi:hypothetical protein
MLPPLAAATKLTVPESTNGLPAREGDGCAHPVATKSISPDKTHHRMTRRPPSRSAILEASRKVGGFSQGMSDPKV